MRNNEKILIFLPNFLHDNTHGQTFIQTRINEYLKNGYKIDLICLSHKDNCIIKKNFRIHYFKSYKGINNFFFKNINNYNKIFIHFITFKIIKILNNFKNLKLFIWIHGIEGQKWTWYKFDLFLKPYWLVKHIVYNIIHIYYLKNFIKKNLKNIKFFFISKWMKNVFFHDLDVIINKKNYRIIHNPVNNIFFKKITRSQKIRKNVLIIKNFTSKKYAGDITLKYLKELSKFSIFNDYNFLIIGKGKILNKYLSFIKNYKNISILNKHVSQKLLLKYHKRNSILLYLTRMDSQSVTLSEGLASGMVCISSNNSAIPEFIKNKKNGFLISSFEDFKKVMIYLKNNIKVYDKIKKYNIGIKKKIIPNNVCKQELKFING